MKIRDYIQQRLILMLVQPFAREKQIEYKSSLKNATRILILFPASQWSLLEKHLLSVKSVFPEASITILHTGADSLTLPKQPRTTVENLILRKHTYRAFSRSERLNQFIRKRFDIFVDLDPEYSLLGVYLCRLTRAPIRMGLCKPQSEKFYNLLYRGKTETGYNEKITGLMHFLKSLTIH